MIFFIIIIDTYLIYLLIFYYQFNLHFTSFHLILFDIFHVCFYYYNIVFRHDFSSPLFALLLFLPFLFLSFPLTASLFFFLSVCLLFFFSFSFYFFLQTFSFFYTFFKNLLRLYVRTNIFRM